jgi:hypothetical protein
MLSTTFPVRCAVAPQELLPIIPPIVQFMWVAGSGPNRSRCGFRCSFRTSRTIPGSTVAVFCSASMSRTRWQYFDQSMTTAVLAHWPARLVPPPRDSNGTPCRRQTPTAATAASTLRGRTTPIGTCRKFDPSVE